MGLDDDPFSWRATADGKVLVSRGGGQVMVVAGARARRLLTTLDGADEDTAQHALARVTGNYRRGNEKRSTRP